MLFILIQLAAWTPVTENVTLPDICERSQFENTVHNGNKHHMAQVKCIHACDKWEKPHKNPWDTSDFVKKDLWNAKRVLNHRVRNNDAEVGVQWSDPNKSTSWVDMHSLALQDSTETLKCARKKHSLSQKPFNIMSNCCAGEAHSRMVKACESKTLTHGGKKHEFGVRVPFGIKQAMTLDKENGQ